MKIAGVGWVTPLGSGVPEVWQQLRDGAEGKRSEIANTRGDVTYPVWRVPETALTALPRHPRLRRVSAISRFAVAAGLAALESATSVIGEIDRTRTAVVFAVSNGGVIYTKRFYQDIIATGAGTASPLFFPETVFNAPASHLAAIIGIDGATYTLVGDGAIGLIALHMAEVLLGSNEIDHCLVVGAEEADWLLCDAYYKWRLLRREPPIEPFRKPPLGTIVSEGAGAVLLSREGFVRLAATDPGGQYPRRNQAGPQVERLVRRLTTPAVQLVISTANGTFTDEAERSVIGKHLPNAIVYAPKPALGDGIGASAMWQVIIAAEALRSRQVPPVLHAPADTGLRLSHGESIPPSTEALVVGCGMNQQVAGARLSA